MFIDHSNCVWGTWCQCGADVYILQNKHHPWDKSEFVARIPCPSCGKVAEVDVARAASFYNNKILSRFTDVGGTVLDLGCGGGFLTQHVAALPKVSKVIALDNDPDCRGSIAELANPKVEFVQADAGNLDDLFGRDSVDFIISRDVFMFIEDAGSFLTCLTKIVRRGIRQMGWYKPSTQRMKNLMTPDEVGAALTVLKWNVELEYLDWYKSGYFVKADK